MIATVVIDSPVPFLVADGKPGSLLSLPLGPGTVLSHVADLSARVGSERLLILSSGSATPPQDSIGLHPRLAHVQRVAVDDLPDVLQGFEPSDWLLFVDPRRWPLEGLDFSGVVNGESFTGTTHLLAIGSDRQELVECLEYDDERRVGSVRRVFHRVTHPGAHNIPVLCSLVPACAMPRLPWSMLNELRIMLAANGVLSRDKSTGAKIVDLLSERGLLAANEQVIAGAVGGNPPTDFSVLSPGVFLGRGALVSETARIVPPVIIQPGARIDESVKIVGPALVGASSHVQRGATIAQALVPPAAQVSEGATAHHCVVGATTPEPGEGDAAWSNFEDAAMDGHTHWTHLACAPVVSLEDNIPRRPLFTLIKRTMDITVASLVVLLSLPFLVLVAILIKIDSRGPIFFVHSREGRLGRPFPCLKFRTMCMDAHQQQRDLYDKNMVDGPQFKLHDDPRITRLGRFIRNTNIDEIPQMLNVLVGHMSLVGPRPSPFRENQICVPWRRARLSVRPGITGLWQICRNHRSAGDFQQWIFYDTLYVRHASAWLDIKIALATVFAVGGYRSLSPSYFVPMEDPDLEAAHRPVSLQAVGS